MSAWPIPEAGNLEWLARALWPNTEFVRISTSPRPAIGWRRVTTFFVLPHLRRPRLLVPDRPGAGAALAVYNDAMGCTTRLRKAVAAQAIDRRLGPFLGRQQLSLDVHRDASHADLCDQLFDHWVASVIGRPDAFAVIMFGAPRPTRKPVVLLVSPEGQRVAYAKIGWNPMTADMVNNEAKTLQRLAHLEIRSFLAPRPILQGTWYGQPVLITEALPTSFRRQRKLHSWPEPAVLLSVASADARFERVPVGESPWWRDLSNQLARHGQPGGLEPLADFRDYLQQSQGGRLVHLGRWHGDWAPWNMATLGDGRVSLWDWERSRLGVPVGADAAHFAFQVALSRTAWDGAAAYRRAVVELADYLEAAGLDPGTGPAILGSYLIELGLRFEMANWAQMLPPNDRGREAVRAALVEARGGLP